MSLQNARSRLRRQITASLAIFVVFAIGATAGTLYTVTIESLHIRAFDLLLLSQNRAKGTLSQLSTLPTYQLLVTLSSQLMDRTGLGKSGETYLMNETGALLTESRFLPNPKQAPIPESFIDHWSGIKTDYRGIKVLAVWDSILINDQRYILASEIDESEISEPVNRLVSPFIAIYLVISALIFLLARKLANTFSYPFEQEAIWKQEINRSIFIGQEQERKRISMELHDDLGPRVSSLSWQIEASNLDPDQKAKLNLEAKSLQDRIRNISNTLSVNQIEHHGLIPAIEAWIEKTRTEFEQKGIHLSFSCKNAIRPILNNINPQNSILIFRVIQEGLQNILKHSEATEALLSFDLNPQSNTLTLLLSDNGVGFDVNKANHGNGLNHISARVSALSGEYEIRSVPKLGTELKLNLKLEEQTKT